MFFRKYWIPLSVFIVVIVGVSLYLLATQPPKDPIVIYKPVEPLPKSTEQPKAEVPSDTSQDGHFHADGTWHEGPHADVREEVVSNTGNVDTLSAESTLQWLRSGKGRRHIPEHLLEAQRLVSVDTARSKAAFRAALPENSFSHDFEVVVKAAIRKGMDIKSLPAEERNDMVSAITHNLMMAAFDEATALSGIFIDTGNRVYKDRSHEIYSWNDPYYALIPKPKLNADQLAQIEKAADELDALLPKTPLSGEPLPNPYRERLQEEENR